jgi:hypothetical protein
MAPTAGIDWASEAHEVCVSEEGQVNERFSATHDERGVAAVAAKLVRLGVCRVAIERPDGILVERLLAAGLEVLAIHPSQDHPHAIRTLGRAWIRVLWRCWRDEVPYDPTRHGNFGRLQTGGG